MKILNCWKLACTTVISLPCLLYALSSYHQYSRFVFTNEPCDVSLFRCDNGLCTKFRCDGDPTDCDNDPSNERNCHIALKNIPYTFKWIENIRNNVSKWLVDQVDKGCASERWGFNAARASVALYLNNETYFAPGNETGDKLAYELKLQFYSKLTRMSIDDIPSTVLASFLNAFLVSCVNPRDLLGIDLVAELRNRVNESSDEFVHPLVFLALCNANDTMATEDITKLNDIMLSPRRELWTDIQAYGVMAVACITQRLNLRRNRTLSLVLKRNQDANGIIDNLKTTALVLQALLASEDIFLSNVQDFNQHKAIENVVMSAVNTTLEDISQAYYTLPVFSLKSFINIGSNHCNYTQESNVLSSWHRHQGTKVQVHYSLWLGNDRYFERTLKFVTPVNTSFYEIMQVAEKEDNRYRFKFGKRHNKPYVFTIAHIQEDPEENKFWFLYRINGSESEPIIVNKSPIDYYPQDGEHLVYWFKSGPWITN